MEENSANSIGAWVIYAVNTLQKNWIGRKGIRRIYIHADNNPLIFDNETEE